MISKKMAKALTKQINAELYSSYLYMSMSSEATHAGLLGTANWLAAQAQEELTHALKFYKYMNSQGEHVELGAIAQPPTRFGGATAMFEATLKHEKKVTAMIADLANLAAAEKDHATAILLQWFVSEQVEEEENATEVLTKLKMAGDKGAPLFMIDRMLGERKPGG